MNLIEEIIDIENINTEFKVGDKVRIIEGEINKIGKVYEVSAVKKHKEYNPICTEEEKSICKKTSKDTCILAVREEEEDTLWSCYNVMRKVKER